MASATADFERIYRRHARDVYRFALSVVRNPLEAEDVTQTTFLNAYRALERGDRPDRPRSWLLAIAHNAIRSRDRWRLRRPPEVPLDVAEYRLAAQSDETPAVGDLLHALGDLPDAQREALARRELQGQTYPEIAEVLGVSVSAVESLIARARRALRAQRERLAGIAVLRRLCEQGDGGVAGLAAKASVVAAAAAALAGGMAVETHVAGPPRDAREPAGRAAAPLDGSAQSPVESAAVGVAPTSGAVPGVASAPATAGPLPPGGTASAQAAPTAVAPASAPAAGTTAAGSSEGTAASTTAAAQAASTAVATAAATTSAAITQTVTSSVAATVTTVAAALPTTPTVTSPAVTVPATTLSAVTTPLVTTPTVTTPAVTIPTVTVPPPTAPLP